MVFMTSKLIVFENYKFFNWLCLFFAHLKLNFHKDKPRIFSVELQVNFSIKILSDAVLTLIFRKKKH